MKPKTARRILKKRAVEIARYRGFPFQRKWLHRLEDKCRQIVAEDKMEEALGRRHMS
ncbi:MAG: hypothetical protein WC343_09560 [Bacilli bacterium]|jgi:hypothetical protein